MAISVEIAIFPTLSGWGFYLEFCKGRVLKTYMMSHNRLSNSLTICVFVLVQYYNVTAIQTDYTYRKNISIALYMLTRDKIRWTMFTSVWYTSVSVYTMCNFLCSSSHATYPRQGRYVLPGVCIGLVRLPKKLLTNFDEYFEGVFSVTTFVRVLYPGG